MPQKKIYEQYFTTMTLGVEKKITQLLNYVGPLSPTAIGELQERMLMDLTRQLQKSIDHLQLRWLEKTRRGPATESRESQYIRGFDRRHGRGGLAQGRTGRRYGQQSQIINSSVIQSPNRQT